MGSGGVGKTTVAAALALSLAMQKKRVLVLTIDPSKRLATALGLKNWNGQEAKVLEFNGGGVLYAAMIEAKAVFDEFVNDFAGNTGEIKKIFENAFYRELSTSLSGTQEFTSLHALYKAYESKKYDVIILDTPPAQHTLEFVEAPQHIYDLFSGSVVEWFSSLTQNRNSIFDFIHKGTLFVFKIFEKITGNQFLLEMETFFKIVSRFRVHIKQVSQKVIRLLSSSDTAFVLVSRFDFNKLFESQRIMKDLMRQQFNLSKIIINGVLPYWDLPDEKNDLAKKFKIFCEEIKNYNKAQEHRFENISVLQLPYVHHEQPEIDILKSLANEFNEEFNRL